MISTRVIFLIVISIQLFGFVSGNSIEENKSNKSKFALQRYVVVKETIDAKGTLSEELSISFEKIDELAQKITELLYRIDKMEKMPYSELKTISKETAKSADSKYESERALVGWIFLIVTIIYGVFIYSKK